MRGAVPAPLSAVRPVSTLFCSAPIKGYFCSMRDFKKTGSVFFLGVFSIFLLHQAIPHVHHEEATHAPRSHTSHHHDHHHEHDGGHKHSETPAEGGLAGALDLHAHTIHSADMIRRGQEPLLKAEAKVFQVVAAPLQFFTLLFEAPRAAILPVHHPPPLLLSPCLQAHDLRGPPVLG